MTTVTSAEPRVLEGHFACGSGLLVGIECLGRVYPTKTASHVVAISLPRLKSDWQKGLLDPPAWTYATSADAQQDAELSDGNFKWGTTVGFHTEPSGTQVPDFARVLRWRFETEVTTTNVASDFFDARAKAVQELEGWWTLLSSWISIFTKQDFVDIGKTRSGIRVGPIVTWSGNADGRRSNGSRDTSIPIVSDEGVDILNDETLKGCISLAANGTQPPDEWLFIRDARALVNARQYRRAVIDAGTAAELAMTKLIDRYLAGISTDPTVKELLMKRYEALGGCGQLLAKLSAGTLPQRLQQELGEPRNNAAHAGASPTEAEANTAIDKAVELVEQAYPLTNLLPSR